MGVSTLRPQEATRRSPPEHTSTSSFPFFLTFDVRVQLFKDRGIDNDRTFTHDRLSLTSPATSGLEPFSERLLIRRLSVSPLGRILWRMK
jgi:hypothetical protein